MDFGLRAADNFSACCGEISSDLDKLTADHANKGILKSAATVRKSVQIFEQRSSIALAQTLEELAKIVDHRGREWKKAIKQIGGSLEEHIERGPVILEKPLKYVDALDDNGARRAALKLLGETAERLRKQLNNFGQGWTAPKPMDWKDRHPYLDRVLFSILGAIIAGAVAILFKLA